MKNGVLKLVVPKLKPKQQLQDSRDVIKTWTLITRKIMFTHTALVMALMILHSIRTQA